MKKTLFVSQPFGLGDILFVQKIIHNYADMGFNVLVPILEASSWLRYYLQPYPNVEYPIIRSHRGQWTGDFKFADIFIGLCTDAIFNGQTLRYKWPITYNAGEGDENQFVFVPLGSTFEQPGARLMSSKYEFAGLDHSDWIDHVKFRRRPHVERELYYDVLSLDDQSCYTLVNEHSSRSTLPMSVPGHVVNLRQIDGFTLFDWFMVIERAAQIVTIDTSLVLLTEILRKQKPLYMISRYNPPSFTEVTDILSLNWNLVPTTDDLDVPAAEHAVSAAA